MALVSNAWLSIKRHLPVVGDDASFQYHTLQGMMRKRTLNEAFDFLNDTLPQGATAEQKATARTATQANNAQQPNNPVQEYLNSRGIGKQSILSPEDLKLEQDSIWKTTFGDQSVTQIRTRDLNDVINYSVGNRSEGAKHIIRRHIGNGKYGEVSDKELLQMGEIIRNGKIIDKVKTKNDGSINYGYELYKDGIRFRVIINKKANDEKIVSMFSDRLPSEAGRHAQFKSSPVEDIIPQNTENTAKNSLNPPTAGESNAISNFFSKLLGKKPEDYISAKINKTLAKREMAKQPKDEAELNKLILSLPAFKQLIQQIQQNNNNK